MKNDKLYHLLVSKMQEVAVVPPQEIGPLTDIYKRIAPQFKVRLWKSTAIISVVATITAYLLTGAFLVKMASILQYGF